MLRRRYRRVQTLVATDDQVAVNCIGTSTKLNFLDGKHGLPKYFQIIATDCFLFLRLMITLELKHTVRNVQHLTLNISKLTTGAII